MAKAHTPTACPECDPKSLPHSLLLILLLILGLQPLRAQTYPVQANVFLLSPYSSYLSDYYATSRERLVVTLLNRDQQQPTLEVRLRVSVTSASGLKLQSREEVAYPTITLDAGIPTRLTQEDLAPYFQPANMLRQGSFVDGQLPDGMVEFTVQAVEKYTGKTVSAAATGRVWLAAQKPPVLRLPSNGEQVAFGDPPRLKFQWEPRHRNISQVEYEFELREIPSTGVSPQGAFAYSPVVYSDRFVYTYLLYTAMEPPLEADKTYAWRVRAVAKDGADELNLFDNGGYSEVYSFRTTSACQAPVGLEANLRERTLVLSWTPGEGNGQYVVQLRLKNDVTADWQSATTYETQRTVYDLQRGATYEYRVGGVCTSGEPVFGAVGEASVPAVDSARLARCGTQGKFSLDNQTPIASLSAGEVVMVNDFPMTLTRVSGGGGTFSGEGWIPINWVLDQKLAVSFDNITVNTDRQMTGGSVKAKYDSSESQVANLDGDQSAGQGDSVQFTGLSIDFVVPENPAGGYDPETGQVVIYTTDGQEIGRFDVAKNENGEAVFPVSVKDKDGKVYEVRKEEDGNGISIASKAGLANSEESNGNTQESQTKIGENDTSLYLAIKESDITLDGKKAEKVTRYYGNNETIILPPGKYKFHAYRKYVEVIETNSTAYDGTRMANQPIEIKDIKDLNLLSLSADKTAYAKENGEQNSMFQTLPYLWDVNSTKYGEKEGANDVEYTFSNSGNYLLSIQTRRVPFQKATTGADGKVKDGGYIEVQGIANDYKLNILVLDPEPVYFTRGDNYNGECGFDNYEKTELRSEYESLELKKVNGDKISYAIPYMSVKPNQACTILASVLVSKDYMKALKKDVPAYTFAASDDAIQVTTGNISNLKEGINKISLSITCSAPFGYGVPKQITVFDLTGKAVGQMNIYCANNDKSEKVNLVKVYFGDKKPLDNPKTPDDLLNDAVSFMNNHSYNQLFTEFSAGEKAELSISDKEIEEINKEHGGISQILNENGEIKVQTSGRNPEYGVISSIMEKDGRFKTWTGKTIVVIANRNKELDGNFRTSGISFTNTTNLGNETMLFHNGSEDFTTYVHEVGHLLGLAHPFAENDKNANPIIHPKPDITQGTTLNFMDYAPITNMFWKWQWDILRENMIKKKK